MRENHIRKANPHFGNLQKQSPPLPTVAVTRVATVERCGAMMFADKMAPIFYADKHRETRLPRASSGGVSETKNAESKRRLPAKRKRTMAEISPFFR